MPSKKGTPSQWRVIIESMFHVVNKQGKLVPFKLNDAQARLDRNLTGRDIIPKARQVGMSTYFLGRFTAKCLTLDNRRAVIVSHEEKATKRLLERVRGFIDTLRINGADVSMEETEELIELDAGTKRLSKAEITFAETGSWFFIGTAGSGHFGRGDTITDLHCSEFAFWPHPKELARGLFTSVPDINDGGEIFIESTGNGIANDFAVRVNEVLSGKSYWAVHFFPWHTTKEYSVPVTRTEATKIRDNLREDLDEPRIVKDFKLTPGQIQWRRNRLADMGGDLLGFKQENPMTIDECFQATGNSLFQRITYLPTAQWVENIGTDGGFNCLPDHPKPDHNYIIGADSAGGLGLDNAVMQIVCVETNEQVACWWSAKTPPDIFAKRIFEHAQTYNKAYVVVESNNHGLTVINELRHLKFPMAQLHKFRGADSSKKEAGIMDLGYQTTAKTKPLAVGRLRKLLADGLVIHDSPTYMELQAFVETPEGRLEAQEGAHDDRVMAFVMLAVGVLKATLMAQARKPKPPPQEPDPFSLEGIHKRIDDENINRGYEPEDAEAQYEDYDI